MTTAFVDTNIFIRFLTNDNPDMQRRAAALFDKARQGKLRLVVLPSTIAEVVYVLHSKRLYNQTRGEIVNILLPLIKLAGIKVIQRQVVFKALSIFASTKLNFGDAIVAAYLLSQRHNQLYSFDHDFDDITGITRLEPELSVEG